MGPKVVAEEQWELLGEAARPTHVDVRALLARWLPEVPFGAFGVIRAVDVAEPFKRAPEGVDRLEERDRDLDVEHGLGCEPEHGGRSDVVDPHGHVAERVAQLATQLPEPLRPVRIVGRDPYRAWFPG